MIDLTKIKKFPVLGFIRNGTMVSISEPDKDSCIKVYTATFYQQPDLSYFVTAYGKKLQEHNFTYDITRLLVPQEELLATEKELEDIKQELKQLKVDTCTHFNIEYSKLQKELEGTKKQIVHLNKLLGEMDDCNAEFSKKLQNSESNLDACNEILSAAREENAALRKELEETKQEIGQLKIEYSLASKQSTRNFETQIEKEVDLNNQIKNLTEELEETKSKLKISNYHRENLLKDRQKLCQILDANEKAFTQEVNKSKSNEEQLKKLKVSYDNLKDTNIYLKDYITERDGVIDSDSDLLEKAKGYSNLKIEYNKTLQELEQIKKEHKLLNETYSNSIEDKVQGNNVSHDFITELKTANQYLDKELFATKIKLHEATINRDHFYSKLKELEETKQELEATKKELEVTKRSQQEAFNKVEKLISDSPALSSLNEYIMKSFGLKS